MQEDRLTWAAHLLPLLSSFKRPESNWYRRVYGRVQKGIEGRVAVWMCAGAFGLVPVFGIKTGEGHSQWGSRDLHWCNSWCNDTPTLMLITVHTCLERWDHFCSEQTEVCVFSAHLCGWPTVVLKRAVSCWNSSDISWLVFLRGSLYFRKA